jgi:hypothetical protein
LDELEDPFSVIAERFGPKAGSFPLSSILLNLFDDCIEEWEACQLI